MNFLFFLFATITVVAFTINMHSIYIYKNKKKIIIKYENEKYQIYTILHPLNHHSRTWLCLVYVCISMCCVCLHIHVWGQLYRQSVSQSINKMFLVFSFFYFYTYIYVYIYFFYSLTNYLLYKIVFLYKQETPEMKKYYKRKLFVKINNREKLQKTKCSINKKAAQIVLNINKRLQQINWNWKKDKIQKEEKMARVVENKK